MMTTRTKPSALSRRSVLSVLAGAASVPLLYRPAGAQVRVDITQGNFQPLPIAIPNFLGDTEMGRQIVEVVTANLRRSGYFQVLDQRSYVERISSLDVQPNFQSWRVINAQSLAVGNVSRGGQGLVAQYRLWDIFASNQLDGKQFTTTAENWRRLAHIISDAIYTALTGEGGYFDSRIVFVDESGTRQNRSKRLAVMDQDGANIRYLTQPGTLVLTPRFSPSNMQIAYMQFGGSDPRVVLLDIASGQRQTLGDFPGMSFAPRFAPDGRRVLMSLLNQDGNSNIALLDIGSRQMTRLTSGAQIDTAASFAPDSQRIVFESDRGGGQQLYVMGAGGGNATRISFGDGRYSTPVWSPRGDLIAFTKQTRGQFSLGVMRPDGSGERILTAGFHNEGPSWSPNGRVITFFKEQGPGPRLFTIDITGRFEQALGTPNFGSDPAWSPLLT